MLKRVDPSVAHRLFYPGVPAVLAASSGETVAAMPVVSYLALSAEPPLFGVSCSKDSFTLRIASASGAFSLCLLGEEYAGPIGALASSTGRRGADKLADAGLRHRRGSRLGAPIIVGSAAALECSLQRSLALGDHFLLVGKIEAALATSDFRGYWRFKSYHPLLYTGWQGGLSLYGKVSRRTR
ncbi:MAG TPA: flavin reductase family protein [Nitrososphaerales archaeon]|nr:flavin reductase family protein [Nitrososphaerales archaeon]